MGVRFGGGKANEKEVDRSECYSCKTLGKSFENIIEIALKFFTGNKEKAETFEDRVCLNLGIPAQHFYLEFQEPKMAQSYRSNQDSSPESLKTPTVPYFYYTIGSSGLFRSLLRKN